MPKEKSKVTKKNVKGKRHAKRSPEFQEGENPNDVAWYKKYPALVEASSSLIFNTPYGYNMDPVPTLGTSLKTGMTKATESNAVPGIVAIKFDFTLAQNGTELDPINIASKNEYTYVRHANSGSANYESSDMMQYNISVLNVATLTEQCKRDLRLVSTFNPLNRYVFRTALMAHGWSNAAIDDMIQNNAQYVAWINLIVAQLNTFKIPRDFPIFDKFQWMVTNIFKDDELDKASYYYYYTNNASHYDWANRSVNYSNHNIITSTKLSDVLTDIQNEINNLLAYEDIGIMIGDILKAYKQEGCRVWAPMQLGEVQDSSYSPEVLQQMQNAVIVTRKNSTAAIKQVSSNSQLLAYYDGSSTTPGQITCRADYNQTFSNGQLTKPVEFNPMLVVASNSPSNDELILSTRSTVAGTLQHCNDGTPDTSIILMLKEYPTHLCTKLTVLGFNENGTVVDYTSTIPQNVIIYDQTNALTLDSIVSELRCAKSVSKFPTIYLIGMSQGTPSTVNVYVSFAGKNNQIVSKDWLNRLHSGIKLSEFSLPMFKLLESN